MECRALYTSIRLNWLSNPALAVPEWQVVDYRSLTLEQLFQALEPFKVNLDRAHFIALADEVNSPEELTDILSSSDKPEEYDHLYLIVFELWRRLLPERPSLSIFCDELDYQIANYDQGRLEHIEDLEDIIDNLQNLLDEQTDENTDAHELFANFCLGCAHDIEGFLYDYISTLIDNKNYPYAQELIEAFLPYVEETKWFEYLKVQCLMPNDEAEAKEILDLLIKRALNQADADFNLELLSYLAEKGDKRSFIRLIKPTFSLIQREEELWDILASCEDFFHFEDQEAEEKAIREIRQNRAKNPLDQPISANDSDILLLQRLVKS